MADGMQQLRRVGIALGSNIGDRLACLERACDELSELFGALRLSQVYETEPVGCPEGSPAYLNACVEVESPLEPEQILRHLQRIEEALGRVRHGVYGEPRTCDLDLLYVGDLRRESAELVLPHPRAHLREFVLRPLADIDPLLVLPGQTQTVARLLEALPKDGPSVRPFPL